MKKSELKQIIKEEIIEALNNKEIKVGHRFMDDGRRVEIIGIYPESGNIDVEPSNGMSYMSDAESFGFVFRDNKLYKK